MNGWMVCVDEPIAHEVPNWRYETHLSKDRARICTSIAIVLSVWDVVAGAEEAESAEPAAAACCCILRWYMV